jgi:hypothetical protein
MVGTAVTGASSVEEEGRADAALVATWCVSKESSSGRRFLGEEVLEGAVTSLRGERHEDIVSRALNWERPVGLRVADEKMR